MGSCSSARSQTPISGQRTHYGFRCDNGHCFLKEVAGDFCLTARARFAYNAQYDQCGLFARVDAENWIKCSMEYETPELARLGSVVTNRGYSDWASQDVSDPPAALWYRVSRTGDDFLLECSDDGSAWRQLRVTHLHEAGDTLAVGVYACSPKGKGFDCTFDQVRLGDSTWR